MGVLNSLKAIADRMIAQEGQSVTVGFLGQSGTYDPTTGKNTPAATVSITSKAVFLDYALESYSLTNSKGTLIEKDDKEVYLSHQTGFPRKPSPTDTIIDASGVKWRIITVKEDNPSGALTIKYTLQVRR